MRLEFSAPPSREKWHFPCKLPEGDADIPNPPYHALSAAPGPGGSCIKFFDCTNAGSKHAYQSIQVLPPSITFNSAPPPEKRRAQRCPARQDTHCVNSIAYHPSGDFVLAGTDHNYVR